MKNGELMKRRNCQINKECFTLCSTMIVFKRFISAALCKLCFDAHIQPSQEETGTTDLTTETFRQKCCCEPAESVCVSKTQMFTFWHYSRTKVVQLLRFNVWRRGVR